MFRKSLFTVVVVLVLTSCISTKLTIKNIDDSATRPEMLDSTTYKLTKHAKDHNYGFDQDYPVNLGFGLLHLREANIEKYLNALQGPEGQKITYTPQGNCCPFPTDKSQLGSGMLEVYQITWEGNSKPKELYLNTYEKGEVLIPIGLTAKK